MNFPDWLSAFCAVLDGRPTPEIFKRWAGLWALSAAMQRRVWMVSSGEPIYGNFYIFLCGPSGTGKGVALDPVRQILSKCKDLPIAPSSVTSAALADELADAHISYVTKLGEAVSSNPLAIVSNEAGVFLPEYDRAMMANLTDLFDNKGYSERRRGRGERLEIPDAHLSLIAGCTPAYLMNTLPEGAWAEGFMSRVVMAFGQMDERQRIVEDVADTSGPNLLAPLIQDLEELRQRHGRVRWTPEGLEAFNHWWVDLQGKPTPNHPKLLTYCSRRHYNLMKMCLIHAVSRGAERIGVEDFTLALDLLLETEAAMPTAFQAMRTGGDQQIIQEAAHFVYHLYLKKKKPVERFLLVRFIQDRAPSYSVDRILEVMVAARYIKSVAGDKYEPLSTEIQ